MSTLKDKIENALNESRTLILGVEVLIGFSYHAVFMDGFDKLSFETQVLKVIGLALELVSLGLLMSPAPYHRMVAQERDTLELHRFATVSAGVALLPFAGGLAIEVYVALITVLEAASAAELGVVFLGVTLFFWYGLEVMVRIRDGEMETRAEEKR